MKIGDRRQVFCNVCGKVTTQELEKLQVLGSGKPGAQVWRCIDGDHVYGQGEAYTSQEDGVEPIPSSAAASPSRRSSSATNAPVLAKRKTTGRWRLTQRLKRRRDPLLVGGAIVVALLILWLASRGASTYGALAGLAVVVFMFAAHWHGPRATGVSAIAVLSGLLVVVGVVSELPQIQNVLQGRDGSTPTIGPPTITRQFGSPSITASATGITLVRNCATLACGVKARLPDATTVHMLCYLRGQMTTDRYRSDRWFEVRFVYRRRSTRGFVHSSDVIEQASTPECKR